MAGFLKLVFWLIVGLVVCSAAPEENQPLLWTVYFGIIAFFVILFTAVSVRSEQKKKPRRKVRTAAPPPPAAAPAVPRPAPPSGTVVDIEHDVVTFQLEETDLPNPDGTQRQQLLRSLRYRREPFESWDEDTLSLETAYENGRSTVQVEADGDVIGTVPREYADDLVYAAENDAYSIVKVTVTGGRTGPDGTRAPYGMRLSIRI